jgi:SagB-type dehydrogenase family enzyme
MITSFQYHDQTSYARHKPSGHYLDWENQPSVYKTYPGITPVRLTDGPFLQQVSLSQILKEQKAPQADGLPTLEDLSQIFRFTYSLTAKTVNSGGTFYYRSVASAGALYPTEIYLATPDLQGLNEGLYHYSITHPGFSLLRQENFFSFLRQSAKWPDGFQPGITFFFSVIYFRSAWKYRDRAFRYHLLDTGHLIENLLLALRAKNLSSALTYDFSDPEINHFLGLDPAREGLLALVSLPESSPGEKTKPIPIPEVADFIKEASRVARKEVSYPLILETIRAGWEKSLEKKPPSPQSLDILPEPDQWAPVKPADHWPEKLNYPDAVLSRRSKRNFIREPLSSLAFRCLLEGIVTDIPGTREVPERSRSLLSVGLLIGQVEGIPPGFYRLDEKTFQIGLVKTGGFLKQMAQVCLDQMWLANAGLHFLFLTNLDILDQNWGPRGYRYAMMSAGRLGERLYLMSSALGLGCCGIGAFYDQEAKQLLELDEISRLLYLVAVGSIKQKKM